MNLCGQSGFESLASGLDSLFESQCHLCGVASNRYGCVDQAGRSSHLHSLGSVARCANAGVYHHGHVGLFDDDAQEVARLDRKSVV